MNDLRWGKMSREELVSLLIELVIECASFRQASVVSLNRDLATGNWVLAAKMTVQDAEKQTLDKITRAHGYSVLEADGYIIIQKP
jgi:hypothetical protein